MNRFRPLVASFCLLSLTSIACTTATIVPADVTPRVRRVPGEGVYHWDRERGWVWPRYGDWGEGEQIRSEAMNAYQAGDYADALAGFLVLDEHLPAGEPAATANLFYVAECYYNLDNYEEAVEYFTKVYRRGNASPENTALAHDRIYDIAMDYLNDKVACSFLGIRYKCPGRGVDLLVAEDGLITEYQYLDFADDAILEIARYYYDQKQYPEAVPFYERLVRDYCPEHSDEDQCDLAEYRLGLATFKQRRGTAYDEEILLTAERRFRAYLQSHPRGEHAEKAREHLRAIAEMFAERYLKIAKFYLRESQPRAARIYLGQVLQKYTNSAAAREAREIQGRLDGAPGEG